MIDNDKGTKTTTVSEIDSNGKEKVISSKTVLTENLSAGEGVITAAKGSEFDAGKPQEPKGPGYFTRL